MELLHFRLYGKFAHFLRAEASASAFSYPVPPRTVILGILGAVLGLSKDDPQVALEPSNIALSGIIPGTHWHKVKLRKDPPQPLAWTVKKSQNIDRTTAPEKASLILQEWLFQPEYHVWVSLPDPYHNELNDRLQKKKWHYSPSLGLSEMSAELEYISTLESSILPEGIYEISTVFQRDEVELELNRVFDLQLALHAIRMPQTVTQDRVFSHCAYFLERDARPVPVKTGLAYQAADQIIMFL